MRFFSDWTVSNRCSLRQCVNTGAYGWKKGRAIRFSSFRSVCCFIFGVIFKRMTRNTSRWKAQVMMMMMKQMKKEGVNAIYNLTINRFYCCAQFKLIYWFIVRISYKLNGYFYCFAVVHKNACSWVSVSVSPNSNAHIRNHIFYYSLFYGLRKAKRSVAPNARLDRI